METEPEAAAGRGPACAAVALWMAPGDSLSMPALAWARYAGWRRLLTLALAGWRIARAHPSARPSFYLFAVGVDPLLQGRGLASAVLRPMLARADAAGMPCYLENSNVAANTALYEHLGFAPREGIVLGARAPPFLPMWREPLAGGTGGEGATQQQQQLQQPLQAAGLVEGEGEEARRR